MYSSKNSSPKVPFPYEIKNVEPQLEKELLSKFTGERTGFVQVGPSKYIYPAEFRDLATDYWNFKSRPDDVWVASFPRSGTTWSQEMVWMICNNLDYTQSSLVPLTKRYEFFELSILFHDDIENEVMAELKGKPVEQAIFKHLCTPAHDVLAQMKERRFIKTHMSCSLMPPSVFTSGAKVVYVARNPKDVCVSYYHLNRLYRSLGFNASFEEFWDYFERDLITWAPYFDHLREGWERRNDPNVLFLFYEDMIRDQRSAIRRVAAFFGKSLTASQIEGLHKHLSIENFKHNPSLNHDDWKELNLQRQNAQSFVRVGQSVGGWQKEYTPTIVKRVEQWIERNLAKTDMRFPQSK